MSLIGNRLKNLWNIFRRPNLPPTYQYYGGLSSRNPSQIRILKGNGKTIVSTIYNKIAVDCSAININHVRLDDEGSFVEIIDDSLNRALTKDANIDQTGRALIRDIVISMLDDGVVAVVPFETDKDPTKTDSYQVQKLRTAKIIQWFPKHIQVEIYNDETGLKEQMVLEKRICAIIENPFYTIMNEPNSTVNRLMRVLMQLDRTNEQNSAGKLDLIVQLPYSINGPARKIQGEERRKAIEEQLTGSQYGIAYISATEKIVQLNRSLENNLWDQAKDLTNQLYNQLGLSENIFNGTADEKTQLNYINSTIVPILSAITEEMERKWISKTALTQRQGIRFFKDPFKLVPVAQLAEIADKFTRNEIMTSNELRAVIGMKPSDDPKANELRNSNLNHPDEEGTTDTVVEEFLHSLEEKYPKIKESVKIQNE